MNNLNKYLFYIKWVGPELKLHMLSIFEIVNNNFLILFHVCAWNLFKAEVSQVKSLFVCFQMHLIVCKMEYCPLSVSIFWSLWFIIKRSDCVCVGILCSGSTCTIFSFNSFKKLKTFLHLGQATCWMDVRENYKSYSNEK